MTTTTQGPTKSFPDFLKLRNNNNALTILQSGRSCFCISPFFVAIFTATFQCFFIKRKEQGPKHNYLSLRCHLFALLITHGSTKANCMSFWSQARDAWTFIMVQPSIGVMWQVSAAVRQIVPYWHLSERRDSFVKPNYTDVLLPQRNRSIFFLTAIQLQQQKLRLMPFFPRLHFEIVFVKEMVCSLAR